MTEPNARALAGVTMMLTTVMSCKAALWSALREPWQPFSTDKLATRQE